MTIFDRLKYELGTRNASKYFPGTEGDTVLQSYVDDGIELLAERRPTKVKQVVTVAESTQTIDLPEKLWKINVIWSATRKYLPTKPYEVYPGDYLLGVIDEEQSEYPAEALAVHGRAGGIWDHRLCGDAAVSIAAVVLGSARRSAESGPGDGHKCASSVVRNVLEAVVVGGALGLVTQLVALLGAGILPSRAGLHRGGIAAATQSTGGEAKARSGKNKRKHRDGSTHERPRELGRTTSRGAWSRAKEIRGATTASCADDLARRQ